jgi:hypothetical protein
MSRSLHTDDITCNPAHLEQREKGRHPKKAPIHQVSSPQTTNQATESYLVELHTESLPGAPEAFPINPVDMAAAPRRRPPRASAPSTREQGEPVTSLAGQLHNRPNMQETSESLTFPLGRSSNPPLAGF